MNDDPNWYPEETKKRRHKEKLKQAEDKIKQKEKDLVEWRVQKDIEETDKEMKKYIPTTLKEVYQTVEKYLHITDRNRIDTILASALSNQLPGTPIWIFIVGNSGDWKSVFVRSLEGLSNVIKVDQLTKNTLATGHPKAEDLGSELQNSSNIILFPDLASMTSMNTDDKNSIWGQFRNLYDGFINKKTGSGVKRKYENCHVTLIACTTQAIRGEILIHSQLGTRELMYDTNTDLVDNDLKMDKAWDNEEYEEEMKQDMRNVVCNFLTYKKIVKIDIPSGIKEFLKQEAQRLSILRATGTVDRIHKELLNPISPEVPTRLIKQFKRLYIALKSLDDDYSDEKCKEIISHIVNSSGNMVRRMVLGEMEAEGDKWLKIVDLQQLTRLGRKAVKAQLEMMWNLGIIDKEMKEERIGGYVTDYDGHETIRGGRIEEVAFYRYNGVSPHSPPANQQTINNIYIGGEDEETAS